MNSSKQKFDYETKRWGIMPIKNLLTDFQGLELKFFLTNIASFLPSKASLLDLGCGGGNILGYLKKKFPRWQMIGLDISADALAIGQKRLPRIEFIRAPAQKIPKEKESFDIVTAFDSMEHFEELDKVLAEVNRILKKQGIFYISIPLEKQFPSLYWIFYKLGWKGKKDFAGHVNFFNDQELESLLNEHGFKLVKKRFSNHLLFSLFDIPYYVSQSLLGNQEVSFESSLTELKGGFKKSILLFIKRTVSSLTFIESSLLHWFPGGKGHYVFKKQASEDFFSRYPPMTVLEDYQKKLGLKKVIRPKDLAVKKHLARLGFDKAKRILDFGCANGIWLERLLADSQAQGVGVDISERLIEKASARPRKRGKYICVEKEWLLKKNSFDFCFSLDVFEHIKEKKSAVKKIYNTMKPGGRFLFYTLNPNNKYTFDWLFENFGSDYLYRRADHKKSLFPDPDKFTSLLEKEGFKNVEHVLYDGPANLIWDTSCYVCLAILERLFSFFHIRRLIKPVVYLNDLLIRFVFPVNNVIDSLFFVKGCSNGYFIWGEKQKLN